jgi:hypothetical protein
VREVVPGAERYCASRVHDDEELPWAAVSITVENPDSGRMVGIDACAPCWAEAVVRGLHVAQFNTEGKTLVLYHRTSNEAATSIAQTRRFRSREQDEVCFSNRESGQVSGYGEATVRVEVPEVWARLDDEFPDGEKHYRVDARDIEPEWITGVMRPLKQGKTEA